MENPIESALVVLVPEAENLVEPFRMLYDSSAELGVPAHVTVLYPFRSPDAIDQKVIAILKELFAPIPDFEVRFPEVMQFPEVLFLAPEPAEPFRELTRLVTRRFPDTPPYRGAFNEIIPHLTVAQVDDPKTLAGIAAEFKQARQCKLPIHASVTAVSLLENSGTHWHIRAQFPLRKDRETGLQPR